MIIIATRPVPRLRNGLHMPLSWTQPKSPEITNAAITAVMNVMFTPPIRTSPGSRSTASAARAPNVTSSPWAKLVRPVVPKISESPSAARASNREKVMPPTVSCKTWVALPAPAALSSPIGNVNEMSASVVIRVVSDVFFSSTSDVLSGRVSVLILIVKLLPRLSTAVPGRATSKTPWALLVPSTTTSPDSSSTATFTSATGAGGFFRLSVRQPGSMVESPAFDGVVSHVSAQRRFRGAAAAVAVGAAAARAMTAMPIAETSAASLVGRARMKLLSPRRRHLVTRHYSHMACSARITKAPQRSTD